jgi:hypothetical protein
MCTAPAASLQKIESERMHATRSRREEPSHVVTVKIDGNHVSHKQRIRAPAPLTTLRHLPL